MRTIAASILLLVAFTSCALAATPQLVLIGQQNVPDTDGDGLADDVDNAPGTVNVDQLDTDADGIGDAIDPTPVNSNPFFGDPGLGIYGPLPIYPGGTAVFDYTVITQPPGGWGRIYLDFDADQVSDAVYYGPLTTGINPIAIPASFFSHPLWDLNTPGTYTVGMKGFGPGYASQFWALPNITVLPVPEPASLGLLSVASLALLARRRRTA